MLMRGVTETGEHRGVKVTDEGLLRVEGGASSGGGGTGTATDMSETNSRIGAKTEVVAPSDTATSGLNGLFKRLLQKVEQLLQKLVTTASGIKVDGSGVTQPVSGAVAINNLPSVQAVVGSVDVTNLPTTQAIAGIVGINNFPSTQVVSGTVSIGNLPATQPISATALPLPSDAATDTVLRQVRDRLAIPVATTITSASPQHTSVSGSEKLFTVPVGFEWQLVSFYSELTTSATAGNRQLTLRIEDSTGNIFGRYPVGATQSASSLRRYNHAIGLPDLQSFRDTDKLQTPVPPLILPPGFKIRILDAAAVDTAADVLTIRGLIQQRGF